MIVSSELFRLASLVLMSLNRVRTRARARALSMVEKKESFHRNEATRGGGRKVKFASEF